MAIENSLTASFAEVVHGEANNLWDVIALLKGAQQMAEALEDCQEAGEEPNSIKRILRQAEEQVRGSINAFQPFI